MKLVYAIVFSAVIVSLTAGSIRFWAPLWPVFLPVVFLLPSWLRGYFLGTVALTVDIFSTHPFGAAIVAVVLSAWIAERVRFFLRVSFFSRIVLGVVLSASTVLLLLTDREILAMAAGNVAWYGGVLLRFLPAVLIGSVFAAVFGQQARRFTQPDIFG